MLHARMKTAFLHFPNISPDLYFLIHAAVGKPVFHGISMFLVNYDTTQYLSSRFVHLLISERVHVQFLFCLVLAKKTKHKYYLSDDEGIYLFSEFLFSSCFVTVGRQVRYCLSGNFCCRKVVCTNLPQSLCCVS